MKAEVLVRDGTLRRPAGTVDGVTLLARDVGSLVLSGSGYMRLAAIVADARRDLPPGAQLSIILDGIEHESCEVIESPPSLHVRFGRKHPF